jgi:hypothetical protein
MTVMAMLSSGFGKVILGAGVLSLSFVAVASGRDLIRRDGNGSPNSVPSNFVPASSIQSQAAGVSATINRTAKADRAALAGGMALPTRTVAMRLNDLANTSVIIRVPVAREIPRAATPLMKSGDSKPVACEPAVSVLTELASKLPPGRCVT